MRFVLFLFLFISCGNQEDVEPEVIKAQMSDYVQFVNQKRIGKKEQDRDKYILNDRYYRGAIKIYLYSDNNFAYELANLGKGQGTWFIDEGVIYLKSKFDWIPMNYELFLGERAPSKYFLKFMDARGTRVHEITGVNL